MHTIKQKYDCAAAVVCGFVPKLCTVTSLLVAMAPANTIKNLMLYGIQSEVDRLDSAVALAIVSLSLLGVGWVVGMINLEGKSMVGTQPASNHSESILQSHQCKIIDFQVVKNSRNSSSQLTL